MAACSSGSSSSTGNDSRELIELEGLTFVPAAEYRLEPDTLPYSDVSMPRSIVMDLYELTRQDLYWYFARFAPGRVPRADQEPWRTEAGLRRDGEKWPAFLTWYEAREVGSWRGMRLPTAQEWLHVAVGRRFLRYPWGNDQKSLANTLELGVEVPLPVGTFENGRSRPFGCYDLVGNVWEWVEDAVPGYQDSEGDLQATNGLGRTGSFGVDTSGGTRRVSVLGGAYNTRRHPTFDSRPRRSFSSFFFHARRLDPETLSPSIGVRMCADADEYLWEKAAAWGTGSDARERIAAVGRRWAQDLTARVALLELVEELLERDGAPASLRWLAEGARGMEDVRGVR